MYRCDGCHTVIGPGIKCHVLPTEKHPDGNIAKEGKFCPDCALAVTPGVVPYQSYRTREDAFREATSQYRPPSSLRSGFF